MERHGGYLETEAGQQQHQPHEQPEVVGSGPARKSDRDLVVERRAGGSVNEAEAVEQERRRERPEQHVLQPALVRPRVGPGEGDQHVEREAQQLQRDVGGKQLAGGGHVDRADSGDDEERVELAWIAQVILHVAHRHEDDRGGGADEEHAEERRVVIDEDDAGEVALFADPSEREAQDAQQPGRGDVGQPLLTEACGVEVQAENQSGEAAQTELRGKE